MNITTKMDEIILHQFRPNGEWDIFHTTAVWNEEFLNADMPHMGYPHVVFTLHMKVSIDVNNLIYKL